MHASKNILITGGAGFIGSHLVRYMVDKYPSYKIVNFDKLTYAGNLANLQDVESAANYKFVKADICDSAAVQKVMVEEEINCVIHLAAESHVDRSISDPKSFVETNIVGTLTLLNAAKQCWGDNLENKLFYHVSTDEVYGALGDTGKFTEKTAYDPRSPYSASKAGSDHLVRAYFHTFNLPIVISNCSNNYGPYQFPEKLLPLMINNIKEGKELPVYGKGENVRDWLWVGDHISAMDVIFHKAELGETYNIGGNNEWKNLDLVTTLCDKMDEQLGNPVGKSRALIKFVKDRAGHDLRYAIDAGKIEKDLGWKPTMTFEEGLDLTIDWYLKNEGWLRNVTTGDYLHYYEEQYQQR